MEPYGSGSDAVAAVATGAGVAAVATPLVAGPGAPAGGFGAAGFVNQLNGFWTAASNDEAAEAFGFAGVVAAGPVVAAVADCGGVVAFVSASEVAAIGPATATADGAVVAAGVVGMVATVVAGAGWAGIAAAG